ncbi:MAG: pro-sigmaK processing inhibitor BofA family protein [Ruminococcus sp.]|nr:pro-sigmaK processing inhibitor BofA family protein [Ruminococcus sp.]
MQFILFGVLLLILILLALLHKIGKNKRPFLRAFFSMCCGIVAMLAVNLTSSFTGVVLPVSLLSVGVSAGLGVPGVTLLLFLNLL